MAIPRAQEDSWTKEMAKWEQRPVMVNGTYIEPLSVANGGRAGVARTEYPKMIYRADAADGGPRIAGFQIASDEAHERQLFAQGYAPSQEAAIQAVHDRHREEARLAANRVHNERWMSDQAKAEAATADEATMRHLPSVPETPKKRVGRPPKKAELVAESKG